MGKYVNYTKNEKVNAHLNSLKNWEGESVDLNSSGELVGQSFTYGECYLLLLLNKAKKICRSTWKDDRFLIINDNKQLANEHEVPVHNTFYSKFPFVMDDREEGKWVVLE